jgi:hypothetical protein
LENITVEPQTRARGNRNRLSINTNLPRQNQKHFGVSLEELLRQHGCKIPIVASLCVTQLQAIGLYRIIHSRKREEEEEEKMFLKDFFFY